MGASLFDGALPVTALQRDLSRAPQEDDRLGAADDLPAPALAAGRKLVVVGDSSFSAIELLAAAGAYATMVTRLRLDAALYAPAPPRRAGQPGRPRKKGERLPKLEDVLPDPSAKWQELEATW